MYVYMCMFALSAILLGNNSLVYRSVDYIIKADI